MFKNYQEIPKFKDIKHEFRNEIPKYQIFLSGLNKFQGNKVNKGQIWNFL